MADTYNPFDGLSGFFFSKDKNDPRVNPALRQKIALALMARDRKFPKNVGEGLTAVGEAIGDRALMRQIMDADVGQQDQAASMLGGGGAAPGAAPASSPPAPYAPPSPLASAPGVQAIDAAAAPPPPPAAPPLPPVPSQPPPGLANTPTQPPSMLSPDMPPPELAGPEGQLATAPPPVQRSMMSPQPMLGTQMQTPPATGFNPVPQAAPPPPPAAPPGAQGGLSAPPVDPDAVNSLDAQASPASNNVQSWYEHGRRPLELGGLGLSHPQASGLVANLQAESGQGINPWGKPGDDGTAFAAGQWRKDRMTGDNTRQGLLSFAAAHGLDPRATETQQAFMKYEFAGPEKGAYARLTAAQTPEDAATAVNRWYERSADVSGRRERIATALAGRLGGGGQPAPPAPPPQAPVMAFSGVQPAPPDPSSAIRPMPPPTPPTRLAQNGPPDPGYVTPQGVAPQGAPIVPMHPEEQRIRAMLAANPNNEYLAKQAEVKLAPYVRERETRQKEADAKFKSDLDASAKQTEQHYKDLADQAKRIADVKKSQAEIDAARLQETEGKMVRNEDGSYSPPRITGVDPNGIPHPKMTEQQAKSQMFHSWTSLAEEQLDGNDKILAEGLKDQLAGKVPFGGNKVMSAKYRQAYAAAERFIQGFLRDVSGNAISPEEMVKHQNSFLPKYGDDPKTIADKKAARENVIQGMYAGAGPGSAISDYQLKQRRDAQAATDERLNAEMKDAPKIVGKVLVNPAKPNISRVWNGKRWEEY